jgi:hypothetical protein
MANADLLYLRRRAVLTREQCARWVSGAYAARDDWTPCFEGVQFTLGRAFYTHLEEGRSEDYFAAARRSDALVESALPGMQALVRALIGELVGAPISSPVLPRSGWCGPGLHIFPAGDWLSQHGGDVHFDTEGLSSEQLAARAPALSFILMLQPPARGGQLRVWDMTYDGERDDDEDGVMVAPEGITSATIDYAAGDLVAIDSYRLHQIQSFGGERDRISITAHAVLSDGRWQVWF